MFKIVQALVYTSAIGYATQHTDIRNVAENVVAQSFKEHAVSVEDHRDTLTPSERDGLSRYMETPDIREVYPGIGRALGR